MPRRSRNRVIAILALITCAAVLIIHQRQPFFSHPRALRNHAKHLLGATEPTSGGSLSEQYSPIDAQKLAQVSPPDGPSAAPLVPSAPALKAYDGPLYIFAFGDSYTTYNFETSLAAPSPSAPYGNRAPSKLSECPKDQQPSTCTFKWLDYLLTNFTAPSRSSISSLLAWNFARGASTVDPDIVPPNFWGAKALVDQAKEFLSTVDDPAHAQHVPWSVHNGRNAIFVIWFGINDVANTAEQSSVDHTTLYMRVLGSYFKVLEELYAAGARRFILLNLPPLERTPMLLRAGPPHTHALAGAGEIYNTMLHGLAGGGNSAEQGLFVSKHPDAEVKLIDTAPIFHDILDAAPRSAKCAGDEEESCAWIDTFHPAEVLQTAVGVEVAQAVREMMELP